MTKPNPELITLLRQFLEHEARSCSMDFGCITPEYVYRMWGGSVPLEDIEAAFEKSRAENQNMANIKTAKRQ